MIRGTTPTHTFELPFDVSLIKEAKIIYSQSDTQVLCKKAAECEMQGNTITVTLSQEETFKFDCKKMVQIQVRILTHKAEALATDVMEVPVKKCLDDEVIT